MIVSCPSCRTRYRYAEAGPAPRLGRCSRCDETFDLAQRSRQYRILPLAAPQLASAGGAPSLVLPRAEDRLSAAEEAMLAAPRRSAYRSLREWFGLMLLTALGAAGGFHGAVITGGDPVLATAAGTVAGLILGWSWIRAAERKR